MGQASDPDAVIDSRARVYGVTGLRVLDASAFAILPLGHLKSTMCECASRILRLAVARANYLVDGLA